MFIATRGNVYVKKFYNDHEIPQHRSRVSSYILPNFSKPVHGRHRAAKLVRNLMEASLEA